MNGLRRQFTDGKNQIFPYYVRNVLQYITPKFLYNIGDKIIKNVEQRGDYDYIIDRVNYYNKLNEKHLLSDKKRQLADFKFTNTKKSRYFFDTYEFTKYFDSALYFEFLFGDVVSIPATPTIVKSRPISGLNSNSVLMNLDKLRHFTFISDHIPFEKKQSRAIFLSYIGNKPHRIDFMNKFHGSAICLCGGVDKDPLKPEWAHPKISLWEHLKYKFILTIEGNDVATNLKWVMSSNCIAVMPKPRYETWFMEGRLIANHHYIEVKDDYSDFEEQLQYYIEHTEEAKQIIRNANEYIKQFKDTKREKIISYMVMEKYLSLLN